MSSSGVALTGVANFPGIAFTSVDSVAFAAAAATLSALPISTGSNANCTGIALTGTAIVALAVAAAAVFLSTCTTSTVR